MVSSEPGGVILLEARVERLDPPVIRGSGKPVSPGLSAGGPSVRDMRPDSPSVIRLISRTARRPLFTCCLYRMHRERFVHCQASGRGVGVAGCRVGTFYRRSHPINQLDSDIAAARRRYTSPQVSAEVRWSFSCPGLQLKYKQNSFFDAGKYMYIW